MRNHLLKRKMVSKCTLLSMVFLSGCAESSAPKQIKDQLAVDQKTLQAFEQWKTQQNSQTLQKYQQFLAKELKQPPTLFELSYNKHISKAECLKYQFALAPQQQWKNLVKPLKLLEDLKQQKIIQNYRIVSVYRGQQANECSRGAKASKHLYNHAVDFQVFNEKAQPYAHDDLSIQKKLCDYWRKHGKKLNLGLGTYTLHRFHIDLQGYRTWGHNYKGNTSACLKQ